MVSHLSKEQDRFSLLFLEEGEYYFQDYACHLLAKGKPRCDKDMVQPLLLIDGCRKGALRKRHQRYSRLVAKDNEQLEHFSAQQYSTLA